MSSPIDQQQAARDGLFKPLSRVASVIVPNTGEFIHRTAVSSRAWTLRSGDTTPLSYDSETEFLLPPNDGPTHRSRFYRLRRRVSWIKKKVALVNHPMGRKMIKCGLAYWIGSLACFIPQVSQFVGRSRNKHLVATISVYFNPAKTQGNMIQATWFAFIAFAYSSIVDLLSMSVAAGFDELGLIEVSYAFILIVFCAGGLGLIGWSKHWMANPVYGSACSMAATSIITVLTKENALIQGDIAWQVLRQNTITVILAVLISNLVCHILWPIYAVDEMKDTMVKTTDAFSTMLSLITKAFLEGSEHYIRDAEFEEATTEHRAVFTLSKKLVETKFEHYLKGEIREYELEEKLVSCMQRIAQHIGGLRSAASTQFYLLKTNEKQKERQPNYIPSPEGLRTRLSELSTMGEMFSPPEDSPFASRLASSRVSTAVSTSSERPKPIIEEGGSATSNPESEDICAVEVFEEFISHLGPPMKSLAFTMKTILDQLPFSGGPDYVIDINPYFRDSLERAIELFSTSRTEALERLYATPEASLIRDVENAADVEEILAACSYFSFCLEDLAQELIIFLDILHDLDFVIKFPNRQWEYLKFWKWFGKKNGAEPKDVKPRPNAHLQELLNFPANTKTIPNVAHTEKAPFTYKIWKALKLFRRDDVRFGIKIGVGAGLFALPAFIQSTRPFYATWHGEWGLVSYMVVMSLTQGQTNSSSFYRVIGTICGAVVAVATWWCFAKDPVMLSIAGFLIALPCFYIILTWKQGTFGRFVLLTYNLSALYTYTVYVEDRPDDPTEGELDPIIAEIAFHRCVSVITGVMWALFINKQIWPISARKKLRGGLSLLWLRLALTWSRDPLSPLLTGNEAALDLLRSSDQGLQRALLKIQGYLDQSPLEFRLKGPFPISEYKTIIACTQSILDSLHGLSVVISQQKHAGLSPVLLEVLEETRRERRDLATRLGHLFYVLASSMQLTFPLPEVLPRTDSVRDRVLAKVGLFRKERLGELEGRGEKELEIVFTYVLVTGKIAAALEECIRRVGNLYGRLEEEMLEI